MTCKTAPEFCMIIADPNDAVASCVNKTYGNPGNFWLCPQLYNTTSPVDFRGSNGFGLVVAMAFAAAGVGLLTVCMFTYQVLQAATGTPKMLRIAHAIHRGARAFLHREYMWLTLFEAVMFIIISLILIDNSTVACNYITGPTVDCNQYINTPALNTLGVFTGLSFLVGALLSASAGYFGMFIATKANVRTTWACNTSMNEGLRVAFKSGAVMGITVVSFGLLGLSVLYLIFTVKTVDQRLVWQYISGFGFGASSIALFARVGGGVYTKAADVGADLVGKVENDIPEDSPNNPAVIADNVGDNVGDVAGMGADLFESYVGAIIAACTLGNEMYSKTGLTVDETCCTFGRPYVPPEQSITNFAMSAVALPFWIAGFGLCASIIGVFVVRTNADETMPSDKVLDSLLWSIRAGIWFASALVIGFNALACWLTFGGSGEEWKLFGCTIIGLVAGNVIGTFTEYCTSYSFNPTRSIAQKSLTGPATVIIQGLGVGMLSTGVPLLTLVVTILACNALASRYGIALAAVSMLATLGITLATDAYGPVADNAGGIAEMAGDDVAESTRQRTDALDALGNTTAATGKGFAIGSAALTSVALISAFIDQVGLVSVNVSDPVVLSGMLIGSTLPFLFAALTMLSVGRAAEAIIWEVRRQFEADPRLKNEDFVPAADAEFPNYEECVAISTNAAIMEMIVPGGMAIFMPPAVGYLLGALGLVGLLVGSLVTGILLAITMANAGGAWDNAKKFVEKKGLGADKAKGTRFHAAVVVGDTVGDP